LRFLVVVTRSAAVSLVCARLRSGRVSCPAGPVLRHTVVGSLGRVMGGERTVGSRTRV